ncbi:MAG: Uma2 family endonuclease [Planctomycetaceae bacterium]
MPATLLRPRKNVSQFGPAANGLRMTARQYDRADFEPGWRYELISGVLVVAPPPLENERDPNDELGRFLRNYQADHEDGQHLAMTLPEHEILIGDDRRRADRAIWCGLDRLPRRGETPTIVVEFVSRGRRNWVRDYETKRDEYLDIGVREYWIINRFDGTLTVWTRTASGRRKRVIRESQTYHTDLLPGFELPLKRLLEFATRWADDM